MATRYPAIRLAASLLLLAACAPPAEDDGSAGDGALGASSGDADSPPGDFGPTLCPPTGPYGSDLYDILANVTLNDCDGNSHSIHDLCEAPAVWLFLFAGW